MLFRLRVFILLAASFWTSASLLSAQNQQQNMPDMPGMQHDHAHAHHSKVSHSPQLVQEILAHETSGTSIEPEFRPLQFPMLMKEHGDWALMFHGQAFLNTVRQSGPRGYDKFFSTNWFMPMAQKRFKRSELTLRTMISLEPATVTNRFYPLLFQQGETAFGKPINDGQHPHDFIMELAALYDLRLGKNALLSFYAAPVGDPAMGPSAYAHRASASEDPVASLGHHLQDSTHIADDVVTGGLTYKNVRIEASGFHGREPD